MTYKAALAAICAFACAPLTLAQNRAVEIAFTRVPFQQWITQGRTAELPWHPRITPPTLALHQRLAVRVEVELDGNELAKRCCDGQAIALVEITDQQGHTYRNYGEKDLHEAAPGLTQYMINISWEIFLLPGDYQANIAFYYSGHTAHSLTSERIHVSPLKHDPLPASWQNLPAVEFSDPQPEGLDAFLLPDIEGRLHLPVQARRQIHLHIIDNLTPYPSERRRPKLYAERLAVFLPILKTLTQLQIENGTLDMSLLDFTRRRVIFEQQGIKKGQVDWANLKVAMAANSVATVDAHDLRQGEHFGEFFWSEMARHLEQAGSDAPMQVFIVLSGPMDLGSKKPIEIARPKGGNFAVFYIRCDFLQTPTFARSPVFAGPVGPTQQALERSQDGIGKALRPLKPRTFSVSSPQNARDALAAILSDLSRM